MVLLTFGNRLPRFYTAGGRARFPAPAVGGLRHTRTFVMRVPHGARLAGGAHERWREQ